MPENTTGKEKEISQHLFNIHSTVIQHPLNVELRENTQTIDKPIDTEAQEFIQQTTKDREERGYVEQVKSEGVLQNLDSKSTNSKPEKKSQQVQTKRLPNKQKEQNPFQVGEQIIDILTKIRAIVIGVEGEKVYFSLSKNGENLAAVRKRSQNLRMRSLI